jgi:hypothetical protein
LLVSRNLKLIKSGQNSSKIMQKRKKREFKNSLLGIYTKFIRVVPGRTKRSIQS